MFNKKSVINNFRIKRLPEIVTCGKFTQKYILEFLYFKIKNSDFPDGVVA